VLNELRNALSGRVVMLGVGNRTRGDDGVGPMLMDRLAGRVAVPCLDAGVAPENYLEKIVQASPDSLLIVDATDFGGAGGEVRLFSSEAIADGGFSSHALSLKMTCDYLNARHPMQIFLLAVQPNACEMGRELSKPVTETLDRLTNTLIKLLI